MSGWVKFRIVIEGEILVADDATGIEDEPVGVEDAVDTLGCDAHVQVNEPTDDLVGVDTRGVTYKTEVGVS